MSKKDFISEHLRLSLRPVMPLELGSHPKSAKDIRAVVNIGIGMGWPPAYPSGVSID